MKYWILTTEYPPLHGGGISTYTYYTAQMLKNKKHEVTVFIYDLSLSKDEVSIIDGIRVIRFVPRKTGTHKFLGFNAYLSYEYAFAVKEMLITEGCPDIIEAQEYHGIAYYLQQFKLLQYEHFKNLTLLITCHAPSFICLEYNHASVNRFPEYWTGQMERSCIRSADILVTPSRYFVSQAKARMDWNNIKENYIPNPIAIPNSNEIPAFRQNYIICFGKLSPLKGSFELVRYFAHLWEEGFNFPLHIVGGIEQIFHPEGIRMGELITKKYQYYIDKGLLVLHGELAPVAAKKMLQDAHVILVPSVFDNLPYTVLEAMSWGKVVLTSMQGGQSEVVNDGLNGFLFDHKDPGSFAKKLKHILQLTTDQIIEIGTNAKHTIKESFSPDVIYEQKISLINHFLESKAKCSFFPFTNAVTSVLEQAHFVNEPDGAQLLSIVIPYYNMGKYIEECVQSILASDFPEKEIIIVNDGSTDAASIAKLTYIEATYPVAVLHKANEGLPYTRNFGANAAKGKYLAFLDADDKVAPDYYSKSIRVLDCYDNVHFVGCWAKYFEGSSDCWPAFNPEPPYLLVHNMVNSSALVYKKQSFLIAGLNDPAFVYGMEDWDSIISMVQNNKRGVVLPEVLFYYRVRKNSMARNFTRVKRIFLHRLIEEKHASFYKDYGVEIAHILNSNGSGLDFDNPTFEPSAGSVVPFPNVLKERIKEKLKRNRLIRNLAYKAYKNLKK